MINSIIHGDCLKVMRDIKSESIDMILCDLPYGVTQNKKDVALDSHKLWAQYKRIIKPKRNIVLTSQFPYTLELISSNKKWFRYDLIWDKVLTSGFLNANRQPLRVHEHILIFYNKLGIYNPQKTIGEKNHSKGTPHETQNRNYGDFEWSETDHGNLKYPTSIISFRKPHPSIARHPTEKPIELFEWLIETYSNEGDLVLDNCIGSGTTAEACINTNRNFIGIELDEGYHKIAVDRVKSMIVGIKQ